ncbi:hypothetical protein EPN83_01510 [Patescibacteria group bacterium]|nr:MAG: hypothetical protein EPN83_01510 [Patescibacteria group bacterium]
MKTPYVLVVLTIAALVALSIFLFVYDVGLASESFAKRVFYKALFNYESGDCEIFEKLILNKNLVTNCLRRKESVQKPLQEQFVFGENLSVLSVTDDRAEMEADFIDNRGASTSHARYVLERVEGRWYVADIAEY